MVLEGLQSAGLVVEVSQIIVHTEIDFLPLEADAPACCHSDSLVVERIIELQQSFWIGRPLLEAATVSEAVAQR
jgi:hypothetical protein